MSTASGSNLNFSSLGEEFCWHARNFAAIYGSTGVETIHLLLAAAEVSPVDLHGYPQLTPVSISRVLATLEPGGVCEGITDPLPHTLSPGAQEAVARAIGFAAHTGRAPTLRDIWVALCDRSVLTWHVLERLGIDPGELHRRVSGNGSSVS